MRSMSSRLWSVGVVWAGAATAWGGTPLSTAFTYQGQLKHTDVVVNEPADLRFSLWDALDGGSQAGSAVELNAVPVNKGLFTVTLDFGAGVFEGQARWLEIAVRMPGGGGGYTTLTPRQALSPAPFASLAMNALAIGGRSVSSVLPGMGQALEWDGTAWAPATDDNTTYAGGTGITLVGTTISLNLTYADGRYVNEKQDAKGDLSGTYPDPTVVGLQGRAVSAAAPAVGQVLEWNGSVWAPAADDNTTYTAGTGLTLTGTTFRLDQSYADGRYVNESQAAGGDLSGTYPNPTVAEIRGRAVSSNAPSTGQVLKWDGSQWLPSADGLALPYSGTTSSSSDGLTVEHTRASNSATAIVGTHNVTDASGTGVLGVGGYAGVKGECYPTGDQIYYGVRAQCIGGSGNNRAVFGSAETTGRAVGVYGLANCLGTEPGMGLNGQAEGTGTGNTYGAYAWATGNGVANGAYFSGSSSGTSSSYGVKAYGEAGADGPAYGVYGYAYGDGDGSKFAVYGTTSGGGTKYAGYFSGNMTATGTKSFQIDHPLDPGNAYLNHYCAEGPEPLNVYGGTAVLDAAGTAQVRLPAYFEAINRDFRYQLTPIGMAMPNLHVATEIASNMFTIAGGKPGGKVSWEVKGVRNDAYVRQCGAPAEQAKAPEERGKYLHPELFGAAAEMSVHPRLSDDGLERKSARGVSP